jgi:RND family efflux transporter MFP subunit
MRSSLCLYFALTLSLLGLLALGACAEPEASGVVEGAEEGASRPAGSAAGELVETQRVALGTIDTFMAASGSIRARRVTEIGSEVSGRLAQVFVEVGDVVNQGDSLFQIDPAPYEMAAAEASAGLALARAESENAGVELDRVDTLKEQRATSEQHFDQLRTAAAVARARVAQMEARAARARRDLECTLVRAPYAGSIVERRAHEGAMAGSQAILVLQETGALEAVLDVPDAWPAPVRAGDRVRLYVEGLAAPLETRIDRVSDRVDPETHTYEVRGPVNDPSRTVKSGSYVRAEITLSSGPPAPIVPRSALLMRDGRTYVFRISDDSSDTVERVPVRVGVVNQDHAQIRSGLAGGDEIVRGEAVRRLDGGVRIERTPGASAAGAGFGAAP